MRAPRLTCGHAASSDTRRLLDDAFTVAFVGETVTIVVLAVEAVLGRVTSFGRAVRIQLVDETVVIVVLLVLAIFDDAIVYDTVAVVVDAVVADLGSAAFVDAVAFVSVAVAIIVQFVGA